MENGSTSIADLAAIVADQELVDVRLALVNVADGWQVTHGAVVVGAEAPGAGHRWRYAAEMFLERRLPAEVVAGLLRGEPHEIDGLKVSALPSSGNAMFRRLARHAEYLYQILPWPRTEWTVRPSEIMPSREDRVLVGDGPAFLNFEAAFSSFFYSRPPGNFASQGHLWQITQLDRRGWLHRVTISPDRLAIAVKGTHLAGTTVELSTPSGGVNRPVGRGGKVRLRLPTGLSDGSLLLLRSENDWLDYRYFHSPIPGRERDPSVVWDQPGAELDILLAGGEGPHLELKQEIPSTQDSRKTVLKTVAAFASGEGGTVIFGINDCLQPVGLDPDALDRLMLKVGNMIRDSIVPEPPYQLRTVDMDGCSLLMIEVAAGGRWYAHNPARPEFYVRRGASTVPARIDEIAAGFRQEEQGSRRRWI